MRCSMSSSAHHSDAGKQLSAVWTAGLREGRCCSFLPLLDAQGHRLVKLLNKPSRLAVHSGLTEWCQKHIEGKVSARTVRQVTADPQTMCRPLLLRALADMLGSAGM